MQRDALAALAEQPHQLAQQQAHRDAAAEALHALQSMAAAEPRPSPRQATHLPAPMPVHHSHPLAGAPQFAAFNGPQAGFLPGPRQPPPRPLQHAGSGPPPPAPAAPVVPQQSDQSGGPGSSSGNVQGVNAKERMRWTPELHAQFVRAVNVLGGPTKAKPKEILDVLRIPGLSLNHVKSHLQKYRLSEGASSTDDLAAVAAANTVAQLAPFAGGFLGQQAQRGGRGPGSFGGLLGGGQSPGWGALNSSAAAAAPGWGGGVPPPPLVTSTQLPPQQPLLIPPLPGGRSTTASVLAAMAGPAGMSASALPHADGQQAPSGMGPLLAWAQQQLQQQQRRPGPQHVSAGGNDHAAVRSGSSGSTDTLLEQLTQLVGLGPAGTAAPADAAFSAALEAALGDAPGAAGAAAGSSGSGASNAKLLLFITELLQQQDKLDRQRKQVAAEGAEGVGVSLKLQQGSGAAAAAEGQQEGADADHAGNLQQQQQQQQQRAREGEEGPPAKRARREEHSVQGGSGDNGNAGAGAGADAGAGAGGGSARLVQLRQGVALLHQAVVQNLEAAAELQMQLRKKLRAHIEAQCEFERQVASHVDAFRYLAVNSLEPLLGQLASLSELCAKVAAEEEEPQGEGGSEGAEVPGVGEPLVGEAAEAAGKASRDGGQAAEVPAGAPAGAAAGGAAAAVKEEALEEAASGEQPQQLLQQGSGPEAAEAAGSDQPMDLEQGGSGVGTAPAAEEA